MGDDYESVFAKPRDGSDFIDNIKGDTINKALSIVTGVGLGDYHHAVSTDVDITDAITLKAINNLQNDPEFQRLNKKDKKKKLLTKIKETSNRYKGVKTLFLAQSFGKYKEASSSYPFPSQK